MEMFQLKLKEKSKIENVGASLALAQIVNSPISFWIDGSGGPREYCKNSFCGINPKYYFHGSLNQVCYVDCCKNGAINEGLCKGGARSNCFDFLEKKIKEEKSNPNGMFVGYISYDLFQGSSYAHSYPDFFFAYFDKCHPEPQAKDLITTGDPSVVSLPQDDVLHSNMTDEEYLEKVRLIKEEIRKGNVYQVNLTREYTLRVKDIDELELYLRLRNISPNPYGCFFKTPFLTILSSSPEEFIFVKDGYIRTRPIKGTLPKNIFDIDEKNKAENIMIVDLERNDLGRVCEYGSVTVKKLLDVEPYKHLNHVVSTVEGKLREDVKLKDIFRAIFPGGSITGAPKISAMKIINEIEPTPRRAYTGSFGYIKTDGTMNFNILIRTIFVQENKVVFNVGGGIVADSDPYLELEEIRLKAKGIMSALGIDQ